MQSGGERILVDENLRGLARWLRFLGLDATLAEGEDDQALAALAVAEKRLLITRDRRLAHDLGPAHTRWLKGNRARTQLAEIMQQLGWPPPERWFSRCVLCNVELRAASESEAARAPAGVGEIWYCEKCTRLYWRGSHYERTRNFLAAIRAEAA